MKVKKIIAVEKECFCIDDMGKSYILVKDKDSYPSNIIYRWVEIKEPQNK